MQRCIPCPDPRPAPRRTPSRHVLSCGLLCLALVGCLGGTADAAGSDSGGRATATCDRPPRVAAWTAEAGADESVFLTGIDLPADALLRVQPATGEPARQVSAHWADGRYLLAVLPADLPDGPLLGTVGRDGCWSEAFSLNAPQPWWIHPEQPAPGGPVRVFGHGLRWASGLYLEAADGTGRHLVPTGRSVYWIEARLPTDLPPGPYRLRVDAKGMPPGPTEDVSMDVVAPTGPVQRRVEVNTATQLVKVLRELAGSGGEIRLKAGRYALDDPLRIPASVTLRGAGASKTTLSFGRNVKPTPGLVNQGAPYEKSARMQSPIPGKTGLPAAAGILIFDSNVAVADLAIDGGGTLQQGIAIAGTPAAPVEHVDLTGVRIEHLGPVGGTHGQTAAVLARHVRDLAVRDSVLLGNGPALYLEEVAGSAFIGNALGGDGEGVITGREGGLRRSRIENNRLLSKKDGAPQAVRAIWLSTLFGSTYENHIAGNTGADFHPPPGTDQNRGEAILLETALSHPYFGHPEAAGEDSLTLPADGPDWSLLDASDPIRGTQLESYFAVVLDGPGQGQARRVVARDGRTLRLERRWRLQPDAGSTVLLTELFYRNLIVGNDIRDALTGIQLWINGVENVIADNRLADFSREGILLHSAASGGPQTQPPFWPIVGHNQAGFNRGIGVIYFNTVSGNTVRNAALGINVSADIFQATRGAIEWPTSMGNLVRHNMVERPRNPGVWTGVRSRTRVPFDQAPGFALIGNLIEHNTVNATGKEMPLYGGDERAKAIAFRRNKGSLSGVGNAAPQLLARPRGDVNWLIDDNGLVIAPKAEAGQ